ncbi:IS3 family transposase [Nonomuraea diastatica]|uniref:IS3 family transposase n=1 Tax=Nonomuraea diastatica TaxID=1848329 RepID=UPI003CCC8611
MGQGLAEPITVVEFIESQRAEFGVPHTICFRALGVSPSWFYKWKNRRPTAREERRARLDEEIKRLFAASGGTYGSPRITQDLRAAGWKLSEGDLRVHARDVAVWLSESVALCLPGGRGCVGMAA